MTTAPLPEGVIAHLAARDGFLLSRDAAALGLSRCELDALVRAGQLERVARGVLAPPLVGATPEAAYRRRVLAVLAARPDGGDDLVLTGPAAAVLFELPLIGRAPAVVHVASARRHGRKPGRILHDIGALEPSETTVVGRWRVATPAVAVIDTARLMTTASGVAAADAALRRGLTDRDQLDEACARVAGRPGVARARRTTRLATPLSESPGESWSAVVLDDLRLPAPQRQQPFADDGGFIGRVDFWWPEERVVGEFDGRVKYGRVNPAGRPPEDVLWDEKQREDRLRGLGQTVVRWTVPDLLRTEALNRRIRTALTRG